MSVRRLYSMLERSWIEAQGLFLKSTKTFFFLTPLSFHPPTSHPAASSSPHSDSSSSSAQPPQPPSYFPGYPAPTPTHSLHNHFACELSSFSFLCVLFSLFVFALLLLPLSFARELLVVIFHFLFPIPTSSAQPCLNVLPFSASNIERAASHIKTHFPFPTRPTHSTLGSSKVHNTLWRVFIYQTQHRMNFPYRFSLDWKFIFLNFHFHRCRRRLSVLFFC